MIQLVPQLKIVLACEPADFRRGIDGPAALCKQRLERDPFSGAVFHFRNRAGTALKLLVYDGQGFWLCHKLFSKGRLAWWPEDDARSFLLTLPRAKATRSLSSLTALPWASFHHALRAFFNPPGPVLGNVMACRKGTLFTRGTTR